MQFSSTIFLSFLFFTTSARPSSFFFFFNDTATTEIYTLSLHDALPIFSPTMCARTASLACYWACPAASTGKRLDRKSTRLNSSHQIISYAVFCLKKKKHIHTSVHKLSPSKALPAISVSLSPSPVNLLCP